MRRIRHGAQQPLWRDGKPSSRAIPANSGLAADHRERLSQRYSEWDLHFLSAIEGGQLVVEYATVCFRSQEDCGPTARKRALESRQKWRHQAYAASTKAV